MHEFSIAMSIIEAAEKEAKQVDALEISKLTLDIGTMSGVEFYALDTALEMAVMGTMLKDSEIIVNKIQAQAICTDCKHRFDIKNVMDSCPLCGSLFHEIISGKELKIKSIVVEDNN